MLTVEEFGARIAASVGIPVQLVRVDAQLRTDLGLDSIQMLDLIVTMDELGAEVPDQMIPAIETVGDLYDHYRTRIGTGRRR